MIDMELISYKGTLLYTVRY